MDSKTKVGIEAASVRTGTTASDEARVRHWNRRLVVAVVGVSVIAVALGTALVVQMNSEEAPPAPAVAEPVATGAIQADPSQTEGVERLPGGSFPYGLADHKMVEHVDGAIDAYNMGAPSESVRMGGHGSTTFGDVTYYRYDPAKQRMLEVGGMEEAIAADHVERTGPVVLVSGFRGAYGWTVAFPVEADGVTHMWIQHWEEPWGEWIMQMWVI